MQLGTAKPPLVLIVEDEALLRWNAVAIVEDAGFDVIEAASADEALAVLEKRKDVRVVFTDVQMPGCMDGLKLAHVIRRRWPPVRIIATSGRAKLHLGDLPEGGRFVGKPYTPADIEMTLHALTAAPRKNRVAQR
jgi:two-component system, response regulator PdtaR